MWITNLHTMESYSAFKKEGDPALAGVAQWTEPRPAKQGVARSIPSQGTWLGFGPGPQWGASERQPHIDVSFPLFPSV